MANLVVGLALGGPPNALDKEILERASTVITSDAVWKRADNRECRAESLRRGDHENQ